ncbi:MAG: mechanosensitive ion channel family protein [Alkalispirochaeta sp.]
MRELFELPPVLLQNIVLGPVRFPFSLWELLIQFLLPAVGVLGVLRLVVVLTRRMVGRRDLSEEVQRRVAHWVRRAARIAWGVTLFGLGSRLLGAEVVRWTGVLLRILSQPFYTSGSTEISFVTLILVIPVFYLAGWLSRATRRMLEHGVVRRLNLDAARAFSLLNVSRFAVMGVAVVVGLSVIGINLSSLAVLFGVLGIGVGFGLQQAVGDMFAGLIIIFSRPIKEGDRVLIDQIEGTVLQIKLLHTVVNTVTHETIIIPNSKITGNTMHNYSYDDVSILLCTPVQVSYRSDLDKVGEVLLDVASRNPWAYVGREHRYRVWSFDDSGITVKLCTWIRDAHERVPALSWTNLEIWRAFRTHGIEIPFPQVDLHVKDTPGSGVETEITPSGGNFTA